MTVEHIPSPTGGWPTIRRACDRLGCTLADVVPDLGQPPRLPIGWSVDPDEEETTSAPGTPGINIITFRHGGDVCPWHTLREPHGQRGAGGPHSPS